MILQQLVTTICDRRTYTSLLAETGAEIQNVAATSGRAIVTVHSADRETASRVVLALAGLRAVSVAPRTVVGYITLPSDMYADPALHVFCDYNGQHVVMLESRYMVQIQAPETKQLRVYAHTADQLALLVEKFGVEAVHL